MPYSVLANYRVKDAEGVEFDEPETSLIKIMLTDIPSASAALAGVTAAGLAFATTLAF